MLRYPVRILTALALISPVFTSWTPVPSPTPALDQKGTVLRPIHPADLEASFGIGRRAIVKDVNGIQPVDQSQFAWGASGDDNTLLLANFTLHAPDGLPIVSLERFDHLIGNIKCSDLNDMISLNFASTQAFEKAELEWKFVNGNDEGKFLFVTDGLRDGCGNEGQRNPFVISNFADDRTTLTTSLAARALTWADVAGSYEMDVGHEVPVPQAHRLKRSWLEGSYNRNHSSNFNISAGNPGLRKNIYTNHDAGLSLDCTNCFIAGSFSVQSHVEVKDFKLQDLVLTASPHTLSAALELEATITATDNSQGLSFNYPLLQEFAIPYAGFSIEDLVSVGASLSYFVGGSCTFSGDAIVDFGVNASVPDSAQIVADSYQAASSVTGFDASDLKHSFHIGNESATVTLSAYSQPELKFGFELAKVADVDVTLRVKLPELNATFTAESDANGACNSSASGGKAEILVDSSASIEVGIDFDAGLRKEDAKTPLWSAQLYSTSEPLPSACYPLDIPLLAPSPSTTMAPSLPTSLSISTAISGNVSVPTLSLGPGGNSSVAGLGSTPPLQGGSSGVRSSVGMTSTPTPTYTITSSSMNSSTTVSSTASGGANSDSTSAGTTFSTSVKAGETSSSPSSSTSEDSEMTSLTASGVSTIISNTRSSSSVLSLPTSTGTGEQSASMGTTLSTVKVPATGSAIVSLTTKSSSTSQPLQSTNVGSASSQTSTIETTSSAPSVTASPSASEPSAGIEITVPPFSFASAPQTTVTEAKSTETTAMTSLTAVSQSTDTGTPLFRPITTDTPSSSPAETGNPLSISTETQSLPPTSTAVSHSVDTGTPLFQPITTDTPSSSLKKSLTTSSSSTQTLPSTPSTTETTDKSTTTPIPTPPSPLTAITSPSTTIDPTPTVTPKDTTHTPSLPQATHESDAPATSICKRGGLHKAPAPTPAVIHNVGGHVSDNGKSQHATASAGCEDQE